MLAHLCLNVGFPGGSVSKESTCNAGDTGSVPGLGKFSGEEKGNPLQYSCLGNPRTEDEKLLASYTKMGCKSLA